MILLENKRCLKIFCLTIWVLKSEILRNTFRREAKNIHTFIRHFCSEIFGRGGVLRLLCCFLRFLGRLNDVGVASPVVNHVIELIHGIDLFPRHRLVSVLTHFFKELTDVDTLTESEDGANALIEALVERQVHNTLIKLQAGYPFKCFFNRCAPFW